MLKGIVFGMLIGCCWWTMPQLTAQTPDSTAKKSLQAIYVETAPKIDGILDEAVWKGVPVATDFIENSPTPGQAAAHRTEVKVVYTTQGIYIGARLYDPAPDSILRQLSVRDAKGSVNADQFAVFIDGMYTQQTDFTFMVTAAGVEVDENDGDEIWDAVWRSGVNIDDQGWTVEMEILYSQLRFPKSEIQTWGINFMRSVRRTRQIYFWSPIDPREENEVQQQGLLQGIERIKPPVRLSFTPYLAGYLNHDYNAATQEHSLNPTFSAGADMKYGINESFTLDVALVPDFGDVQSDNLVFNLSPFEIYYDERRPFFTEGVELFNRAGLFYSRRVGSRPARYRLAYDEVDANTEELVRNPERPYLINALKVSGRTKKGLGLGLFNAVTAPSFARIQDQDGNERSYETEHYTNYNVVVVDQQFWRHSYVSLINTSVVRFGGYTDAIATGTEFKLADLKNRYGVEGSASMVHRFLDQALHNETTQSGYRYDVSLRKFSGNFRANLNQIAISPDYNINDLGFIGRTNFVRTMADVSYNIYQPFGPFLEMWSNFELVHEMLNRPMTFTRVQIAGRWGVTLRNFLSLGADFRVEPLGYVDYFEARREGQPWRKPTWTRINAWFSSDYRKPFALDGGVNYRRFWSNDMAWAQSDVVYGRLSPIIRFSDSFNMVLDASMTVRRNSLGYVTKTVGPVPEEEWIIFGSRARQDLITSISANYLFTHLMSLTFRVRHYWAVVAYGDFWELSPEGNLLETPYRGSHDTNYNAFNIDLIFRWRFAPGSELNIVWKNAILDYGNLPNYDYFDNFGNMWNSDQNNQFSIKALYFLDFFTLFKNKNTGQRF